jgi:DNA-directed RNA polymerase subunit H
MAENIKINNHVLVPKHEKLTEKETQQLFEKYNISASDLPAISKNDVALYGMDVESGDVIKITRKSPTAGIAIFYRGVVNE